jgi:transposase
MMTREKPLQNGLFAPQDLGVRVPAEHVLRRITQTLDLSFVNDEVEHTYGASGHEGVPPTRIMKLLLLLVIYNVSSERALFRDLPMRIDWLWFLGFDLSSDLPNHSVLSKARKRWGAAVFQKLFTRTIQLCMSKGLVDGRDLLADSSLVDANASVDSLFRMAEQVAAAATERLDDEDKGGPDATDDEAKGTEPRYRSKTDPDATGARRRGEKRVRPRYQTHRAIDSAEGVITATMIGPGHENEAEYLEPLIVEHTTLTGQRVRTATADSKYGTADNLEFCEVNQIDAFIRPFRDSYMRRGEGRFTECCFRYDAEADVYLCPAGQRMARQGYRRDKDAFRYRTPIGVCTKCPVRALCTKAGRRSVNRPARIAILDRAKARCASEKGRAHGTRRKWQMEGSFAHSVRLGYKRLRTRGRVSAQIQDYLVAAVQNLLILFRRAPTAPLRAFESLRNAAKHSALAFMRRHRTLCPAPRCPLFAFVSP